MPIFKLKSKAFTRLVSFDAQPTWENLASEISLLFDIPMEAVGVTFIDEAGDLVTLTNEKDLQSFFDKFFIADTKFFPKFVVQNLDSPDGEFQ
jgi:PB1 domain